MTELLAYPNVSDGRDAATIGEVARAFGPGLLDVHSDPDHHRSAYTLVGEPGRLATTVVAGAARAIELIRIDAHAGAHPRVGVVDVAPIVYLSAQARGAACAEALVLADRIGEELGIPVLLYGALADGRTRAQLRRGGPVELARRLGTGELIPDFGPRRPHPTAGATLVGARPPLIAFNVELAPPAGLREAQAISAAIREGGADGLPGVRAIGLWLATRGRAQVSTNIEDHRAASPAAVVRAIARHHPVAAAELVGLAPRAAFLGFPDDVPLRGYATIEAALAGRVATASGPVTGIKSS